MGGNGIRKISIKAQHSAFSGAISKTVSKSIYIYSHGVNNDHKGLKYKNFIVTTFRSITPSSGNRLPLKPLKICLRNLFTHACKNDVSEKFKSTKRIRIKFLDN